MKEMEEWKFKRKTKKIFLGVYLILAAVFLVASQMGFVRGVRIAGMVFAIFWVAVLIDGIWERSFGKILFSLAFLCIIFDRPLHIEAITPETVLVAALLGTIGLNMIFKRRKHWYEKEFRGHWNRSQREAFMNVDRTGNGEQREEDIFSENKIFFRTSFGSAVKYVNSDPFEFAALECSFGAMKVFFDNAHIAGGSATIELNISFGGVELYFPREWEVINHVDSSFGGVYEKNHNCSNGSPVVTLIGEVNFSGVTIVYV